MRSISPILNTTIDNALLLEVSRGDIEKCRELLARGANVNYRDQNVSTPLHWAVNHGHVNVCEFLLSHGADINAKDKFFNSPLVVALKKGQTNVCLFLLAKGSNIHSVLQTLKEHGADPERALCFAAVSAWLTAKSARKAVKLAIGTKARPVTKREIHS